MSEPAQPPDEPREREGARDYRSSYEVRADARRKALDHLGHEGEPAPPRVDPEDVERARVHREVLQSIAEMPTVQRNPDGVDQAAETMQFVAREALRWPASAASESLREPEEGT